MFEATHRAGRRSIWRRPCGECLTRRDGRTRHAEFPMEHERTRRVDCAPRGRGYSRAQARIEYQIDNLLTHAERDDAGRESVIANFARYGEESVGQVDG